MSLEITSGMCTSVLDGVLAAGRAADGAGVGLFRTTIELIVSTAHARTAVRGTEETLNCADIPTICSGGSGNSCAGNRRRRINPHRLRSMCFGIAGDVDTPILNSVHALAGELERRAVGLWRAAVKTIESARDARQTVRSVKRYGDGERIPFQFLAA